LAGTGILLLAVAELALRLAGGHASYVWTPNLRRVLRPQPGVAPGIEGESRFTINRWGIRGDPFSREQTYRFLALGGSTTECLFLDDTEAWPRLLQDLLNARLHTNGIWVGSAGKSGGTTRHHVVQLQKLLPQYPRMDAVLLLVGVNDLHLGLMDEGPEPVDYDRPESAAYRRLEAAALPAGPGWDADYPWFKRTELWRRVRAARYALRGAPAEKRLVQDEAGKFYAELRGARAQAATRERLPDLAGALDEYERNLKAIIRIARERGVRVVFMTQPVLWRADLPDDMRRLLWMGGAGDFAASEGKEFYSVAALADGMAQYNRRLVDVCAREGVECVDLAAALPRDLSVFYDDAHFNEAGARRVAECLADYLAGRPPFGTQRAPF
jgi:lysophospholipase L1-like esterase